ncbi:hypothetical protein EMIHUDRAFT_256428, partial [Emiliania huxleyi CCMP1516]|uniref:Uncharacterized protein n=4 Tax=Emiliania huxleyi TaxID=2903 RepID=A0A0D3IW33_EMIH1
MASAAKLAELALHTAEQSEEELLLSQERLDDMRISRGAYVEVRAVSDAGISPPAGSPSGSASPSSSSPTGPATAAATGGAEDRGALVLRVGSAAPGKGSQGVSLLAATASLFGLSSRQSVEVIVVPAAAAELEWVEMVFRDQYLSRGDIWYWMQQLRASSPNVYLRKVFGHAGARVE